MPRRNTKPEMALRLELHRLGLRYVLNGHPLPGSPDVVFTRRRIALFVDGCFWHSCPQHGAQPKANADWWARKLAGNVARDRRVDGLLDELGWKVVRVWEHEHALLAAQAVYRLWVERGSGLTLGEGSTTYDCSVSPPKLPGSRARELHPPGR